MPDPINTIHEPSLYTQEPYVEEKLYLENNEHEDPFGNEESAEIKYRTLNWWQCGIIMIAETISLGILSFPSAMAVLGLLPGVLIIIGLASIATYTGYVIGQFKQRHPGVHSMADAGEVLWGRIGRELLGMAQLILMVLNMSSHVLTFSVMMNTVTEHGTCSIVFGVVGMLVSFIGTLPRTLRHVSWMSFVSFGSILAAVLITMIAIAIQRPGGGHAQATVPTNLNHAFLAVTNIVFGYVGNVAFFSFISEMRDPADYPKALYLLQTTDTTMYIVAAVVIYYYGGQDVQSPALGSAGPLISKIAYGVAIPTIVVAGIINGHIACKYIYVRMFRGTGHMHKRNLLSTGSWVLIAFSLWVIAWVISEAIPNFNNLLSLMTSLFAGWFTFSLCGIFWLSLNKGLWFSSPLKIFLTILNLVIIMIGGCVCGLGLYVSGVAIHNEPRGNTFSCANNV